MQQPIQPLRMQQRMEPLPHLLYAHCLPFFVSVCALICWHAVTLPPDGSNVTGRPVARGIEHARRGGCLHSEGTAGHCPSLDDCAQHDNVRHIRPGPAAASAHQTEPPWTGTPPSPT